MPPMLFIFSVSRDGQIRGFYSSTYGNLYDNSTANDLTGALSPSLSFSHLLLLFFCFLLKLRLSYCRTVREVVLAKDVDWEDKAVEDINGSLILLPVQQ
jgi:hypothetical protein